MNIHIYSIEVKGTDLTISQIEVILSAITEAANRCGIEKDTLNVHVDGNI